VPDLFAGGKLSRVTVPLPDTGTKTQEQPMPEPLEASQVKVFLTQHFGEEVSETAPLGKGEWSQAFSFRRSECDYVVRFGAYGEDYAKDRLIAAFASPDLPIPPVYEVGQAFGLHFAVSARAFGEMLDGLDAERMRQLIPAILRALDAARQVNLGWSTGYGMWRADGTAPYPTWHEYLLDVQNDPPTSRIHGWQALLAASPLGEGPFDEAFGYLQSLIHGCPEDRHLLHTDLLNHNVLVSGDRISAVINWGNALFGDFLYELALFSFYAPWYPAMQEIDWAAEAGRHYDTLGLSVPHFAERLRCYEIHIGLGGMAYCAFTRRWEQLETTARRTIELARAAR
jgi:hygromycin-B 4-O-kinase